MTDEKRTVPRWADDEIKSVQDYLWCRSDELPALDRTDEAIESKFAGEMRQLRRLGRDIAVRHEASKIALAAVRHKGIKLEGGHLDFCNRTLNLAFFVGGFNTDSLAQKCRKAALDHHFEREQAA